MFSGILEQRLHIGGRIGGHMLQQRLIKMYIFSDNGLLFWVLRENMCSILYINAYIHENTSCLHKVTPLSAPSPLGYKPLKDSYSSTYIINLQEIST